MSWIDNLKRRWNVESAGKVWIILCVFALTGTTIMFLRRFLKAEFDWANEKWFTYTYYWFILPIYNAVLLLYGALFGQFRFFWEFEKRFFGRLVSVFKRKS
ncbi:MAG: hypothetical protein RIT07_1095 [Bacteroidota bacterium]